MPMTIINKFDYNEALSLDEDTNYYAKDLKLLSKDNKVLNENDIQEKKITKS